MLLPVFFLAVLEAAVEYAMQHVCHIYISFGTRIAYELVTVSFLVGMYLVLARNFPTK